MKPSVPVARRSDYLIDHSASHDSCAQQVIEHHYAKSAARCSTKRSLLIEAKTGLEVGAALWMPPTAACAKSAARRVLGDEGRHREVLVLSRLVVAPGQPQNAAGILLSSSIRHVWQDSRWSLLLTYADAGQGHTGTVYKATNWVADLEPPFTVSETWFRPDGSMISKKSASNNFTTEQMEAMGCVSRKSRKIRFFLLRSP